MCLVHGTRDLFNWIQTLASEPRVSRKRQEPDTGYEVQCRSKRPSERGGQGSGTSICVLCLCCLGGGGGSLQRVCVCGRSLDACTALLGQETGGTEGTALCMGPTYFWGGA